VVGGEARSSAAILMNEQTSTENAKKCGRNSMVTVMAYDERAEVQVDGMTISSDDGVCIAQTIEGGGRHVVEQRLR
jgi:uncharacterized protein YeaC (DUF1315 family)